MTRWCASCRFRGHRCPWCRARDAAWKRRARGGDRQRRVTLGAVMQDLRDVARRFRAERVSRPLYQREGSFAVNRLLLREGLTWPELQRMAGLPFWQPLKKGLANHACTGCDRSMRWYGPGHDICWHCRRNRRRRKTCRGWEVDAA
jgi:hypothetical protein